MARLSNILLVWLGGIGLVTAGAAGGGMFYLKHRSGDPYRRAEMLLDKGNLLGARVELRNALRNEPNSPAVRVQLARVLSKLADPVAAEREFRIAVSVGGDTSKILPELGEAMIVQGKYRDVLSLIPATASDPAIAAKDLALRAAAQVALGDIPAATVSQEAAARIAPGSVEAPLIAARLSAARGDLAGTEANVEAVLNIDPKQVEALLMKEQLLTSRKDFPEALAIATRAVDAAPWSAMARIDRAYQLMFANQDSKAQEDVNAVLASQPQFIDAIYLNGILMARRGDYKAAGAELTRLQGMGARFPQAILYLAKISRALGQKEAAAEQARRYNVLVPTDADGIKLVGQTALDLNLPQLGLPVVSAAVANGQNDAETLDLLGRLQVGLGNNTASLEAFRSAAAKAPNDAIILLNLGMAEMRMGDMAAATSSLEHATQLDPSLNQAAENLVFAYIRHGQDDKAQPALDQLRVKEGDTEAVALMTAQLQQRKGDIGAAQATLTASLRKFPASLSIRFAMAKLYAEQGASGQAISIFRDILAQQPGNMDVLKLYLPMLAQTKQTTEAVAVLQAARKAAPSPVLTAMLADAYTALGTPKAGVSLIENLRGTPQFEPMLLGPLARAQVAAGMPEEAKGSYDALLKAEPRNLLARVDQVAFLMSLHDGDAAIASLRAAVAAAPGDMVPMTNLVSIVNASKGLDAASATIEELKKNPANMPFASALKGDLLMRLNRYDDATQSYLAEFRAAPSQPLALRLAAAQALAGRDDQAVLTLQAWVTAHPGALEPAAYLARLYLSARRWSDAEALLTTILTRMPKDPAIMSTLALAYLGAGNPKARALAQEAYLDSPNAQTGDTLGWIMTDQGQAKAAVPLLQLASRQNPADADTRYHLAVALAKDGQTDAAASLLRALTQDNIVFADKPGATALLKTISVSTR